MRVGKRMGVVFGGDAGAGGRRDQHRRIAIREQRRLRVRVQQNEALQQEFDVDEAADALA